MRRVPGGWSLLHLSLALLAAALVLGAARELIAIQALPLASQASDGTPAREVPTLVVARAPASETAPAQYGVIAARNLFAASRSEVSAVAPVAPAVVPGPRSILHGVVLDGDKSRAYLEDAAAGRVSGYAVGDPVAGGRLERIEDDRVTIRGPEGAVVVMLRDSSKPAPAADEAPAPAAPTGPVGSSRRRGSRASSPPADAADAPGAAAAIPAAPATEPGPAPSPR